MRNKRVYFLLIATLAVAVSFVARQRKLDTLRNSNASLHQEIDVLVTAPMLQPVLEVPSTDSVAQLTSEERLELLRLRGQTLPLRQELQAASNRIAALTRPQPASRPAPASELSPELQARQQQFDIDRKSWEQFSRALRMYQDSHAGELPDDLMKVEALARPALPEGISLQFELIRTNAVPEEERADTFIAREKQPRQDTSGKWRWLLLKADGTWAFSNPFDPLNPPDLLELERVTAAHHKQVMQTLRARMAERMNQR